MVVALTALALSNRRQIKRLEARVRALGVVDTIIREAGGASRPMGRHLRRIKSIVWAPVGWIVATRGRRAVALVAVAGGAFLVELFVLPNGSGDDEGPVARPPVAADPTTTTITTSSTSSTTPSTTTTTTMGPPESDDAAPAAAPESVTAAPPTEPVAESGTAAPPPAPAPTTTRPASRAPPPKLADVSDHLLDLVASQIFARE